MLRCPMACAANMHRNWISPKLRSPGATPSARPAAIDDMHPAKVHRDSHAFSIARAKKTSRPHHGLQQ